MDKPQKLARKAEQKTAELHGGRVTPGSGSGQAVKNDVRNDDWSFEVKSTQALSFTLTRQALARANENALSDGRRMAFVVDFLPHKTLPPRVRAGRYVVLDEDDFIEMEQELRVLRNLQEKHEALWRELISNGLAS